MFDCLYLSILLYSFARSFDVKTHNRRRKHYLASHITSYHSTPYHIIHKNEWIKSVQKKMKTIQEFSFPAGYYRIFYIRNGPFNWTWTLFFYVPWEMGYEFHVFLMENSFIKLCTIIPDREQIATIFFIFNCIIILLKKLRWERSMLMKFVRKWAVLFKSFSQSFII